MLMLSVPLGELVRDFTALARECGEAVEEELEMNTQVRRVCYVSGE